VDFVLIGVSVVSAFVGAQIYHRWNMRRRHGVESARNVEAERIVALLSSRQPGVWDADDLRERFESTARDLWTLPTAAAMERLQTWVHPELLTRTLRTWVPRAVRRELRAAFRSPPAFVQVVEGGPGHDRVIVRIEASVEGDWLDAAGKRLRRDRRNVELTYHHWTHIDGQGWRLDQIEAQAPVGEPPPSSVACRILPLATSEESGTQA
jgi:hypothetical protein